MSKRPRRHASQGVSFTLDQDTGAFEHSGILRMRAGGLWLSAKCACSASSAVCGPWTTGAMGTEASGTTMVPSLIKGASSPSGKMNEVPSGEMSVEMRFSVASRPRLMRLCWHVSMINADVRGRMRMFPPRCRIGSDTSQQYAGVRTPLAVDTAVVLGRHFALGA